MAVPLLARVTIALVGTAVAAGSLVPRSDPSATASSGDFVAPALASSAVPDVASLPPAPRRGTRVADATPLQGGPLPRPTRVGAGSVTGGIAGWPCLPRGRQAGSRPSGAPRPYRCPVPGLPASLFDAPQTRYSAGHRGVDLLAAVGEPVRAPAAGTVTFAGPVAGRPVVTVDHGGGWRTSLEPVRGTVGRGARVRAGDVLGTVDPAPGHCAPATCVHVGARRGESGSGYVDPLLLMGAVRVVLLPVGG